ncbi:MAG TPA: 2'-5' RNA ligase family protein [Anaerolineales bacterium]|nr:2'-5' RNA ligase family protein [Anaerolineales bacterium]
MILVPEAEPIVGTFRAQYDPSAADGMPAHVTINYPFLPGRELSQPAIDALATIFARVPAFDFALAEPRRFPDVLYLAPEPVGKWKELIAAVAKQFPDSPPYGGVFAQVTPHLTVAQTDDPAVLEAITREFRIAAGGRLPLAAHAGEVTLMDDRSGRWETKQVFALGRERA